MPQVIVIGAGPAGVAAAVQCSRLGMEVNLLDRTGRVGGLISNAHRIENYPGLETPLSGEVFAERLGSFLFRFGLKVEKVEVNAVRRQGSGFLVEGDGARFDADAVVIATGTRAIPLPTQLPIAPTLWPLIFHEVRPLLDAHPLVRRVIIVGGGEASYDYALTLADAGVAVDLLCRSPIPKVKGRLSTMLSSRESVHLYTGMTVRQIDAGDGLLVEAVNTAHDAYQFTGDALLAAIGRHTHLPDHLPGDLHLQPTSILTGCPGLFICGDARRGSLGQAGIATGDGIAAAMDIAGHLWSPP